VPEAAVNGVRLHYEVHGEGAPIACIHGGGSSAVMWEDAIVELAQRGRVISYDRRGCSRSERPEPYATSVVQQADDAAALLAQVAGEAAVVIARSYGGAIALDLALRYPGRVRALVLLEGDALGLSPVGLEWTRGLRQRLLGIAEERGMAAVYEALIDEVMGPGIWDSFPGEVQAILTANGPALLAELAYVDEPMPGAAELATIGVPTLLVAAEDSPAEQREMSEAMAAVIPDAQLTHVEGGHLVNPASPPVLAFIDEVVSG